MQDPRNFERNHYRDVLYENTVYRYANKVFSVMDWGPGENLLDYGCGPGDIGYKLLLPYVDKHESTLYGVDVSDKVVEYASKTYTHPRIQYHVGDILGEFSLKNVKFDKIFACHVFHCINDLEKTLKGLHNILKRGGKLAFFSFTGRYIAFRLNKMLAESEAWAGMMKGHEAYSPTWSDFPEGKAYQVVKKLLEESGYRVVHLEVPTVNFFVDDMESCLDCKIAAIPALSKIPSEMHAKLKNDMCKMITDMYGGNATGYNVSFEYIVGVAEKN